MPEVELKFAVDRAGRERVARAAPLAGLRPVRRRTTTYYFDTPEGELWNAGMALRLRHAGGRWIESLKAGRSGRGGLHARDEWEFGRRGAGLDLARFRGTPLAALPGARTLHRRLAIAFAVDMVRTAWVVAPAAGSRLEVVLDVGEARSGALSAPIGELEIECLEGPVDAAFDLAARLLEALPMRPSTVTKAERGYRLFRGEPALPVHARPVRLAPSMTLARAAREGVGAALEQLQANEEGVEGSGDPEFVHQARVALRRMRSALRLFRDAIGARRSRAWRDALARFAARLGHARDWDVFALETLPQALAAQGDAPAARDLAARAERRRLAERARTRRALASRGYARTVLEISRWLATGAAGDLVDPRSPLVQIAARVVRKRHRRLLAHARHLARLTPAARHRVRIEAKRLRYAVEGFASLFPSRHAERYREALARLQDLLGEANDAATGARLIAEVDPPPALRRALRRQFAKRSRIAAAELERLLRVLERHGPPAA
jgi:inorganic triphosphatase YgiF